MRITAGADLHFQKLNEAVKNTVDNEITIDNCIGQRYIGAGVSGKRIVINGTPGNALGAYMDGASIEVYGNAQDAIGDTMNGGSIEVYGNAGDAVGYAMRGGRIYIKGDAGYRVGIHMKAYKDHKPVIVIGGRTGSFLGEYQAGGILIVLGNGLNGQPIIGNFCGTGMHGGEMYLRTNEAPKLLPKQVKAERIEKLENKEVIAIIADYCKKMGYDEEEMLKSSYYRITPDTDNPYKTMYTNN